MPPEIDHALEVSGASLVAHHAERDEVVAASQLGSQLDPRRDPLQSRKRPWPLLRRVGRPAAPARQCPLARRRRTGGHLLHVRQHRETQGRHPHPETFGWMVASAAAGLELPPRDDLPGCSSSLAHRRVLLLRGPGGRLPVEIARTSTAMSSSPCSAAPGRRCSACCRPRYSASSATTRRARDFRSIRHVHRRRRQGLGRAGDASSPTWPASRSKKPTA